MSGCEDSRRISRTRPILDFEVHDFRHPTEVRIRGNEYGAAFERRRGDPKIVRRYKAQNLLLERVSATVAMTSLRSSPAQPVAARATIRPVDRPMVVTREDVRAARLAGLSATARALVFFVDLAPAAFVMEPPHCQAALPATLISFSTLNIVQVSVKCGSCVITDS